MKINKEFIDGRGNDIYLGLFPTKRLIEMAGVLIIETDDNYVVYKNRWEHPSGVFYIEDLEGNATHIKDLNYKRITCKDMSGLNDYNTIKSKEKTEWLIKTCKENKYILFDVAIDRVD